MRIGTIRDNDRTQAAIFYDEYVEILPFEDAGALLIAMNAGTQLSSVARVGERPLTQVTIAPPVVAPSKVLCVGLNYYEHAAEANLAIPSHPLLFAKYSAAMIGPYDDIQIPPETQKCDWEAELALVIGRRARRVSRDDALRVVAGYTVLNDITMRDWQKHTSQFLPGKTFESSTPWGPWLVTGDEIDHARDLEVQCFVNGELMQSMSSSGMIFGAAEVISYLSHVLTLEPGDVIAMGTPSGIGSARSPSVFLKPGDRVVTRVEGIGQIENLCVAERVDGVPSW